MRQDHLEILLEDIRSKFDLVLEGYGVLNRKMDQRFDEQNEKIEHNSFLITALNKKIDDVDARLNKKIDDVAINLGAKLDAVAMDLAAHRADTEVHRAVHRVGEGT